MEGITVPAVEARSLDTKTRADDNLVVAFVSGRWWQPANHRVSRFGTLELDEGSESLPSLTLQGALSADDEGNPYPEYPVLLGRTSTGDELTLVHCQRNRLRQPWRLGFRSGSEETISCQTVLRDGHVREPDAPVWTTARCGFDNLDEWADRVPIVSFAGGGSDPDGSGWSDLRITTPPPVQVQMLESVLSIWQGQTQSHDTDSFEVSRRTVLSYEGISGMTLDDIYSRFVMPIRYFLAFATDERTRLRDLHVAGPISDRLGSRRLPRYLDVIRPVRGAAAPKRHQFEMLLPLPVLGSDAEAVITRWFGLIQSRRNALDLMLSAAFGERMFLETRFLLLAQAAEVYHRSTFPGGVLDGAAHQERLDSVLAAAPSEHREWLNGRLEHSNEPPLKRRLDDLVEYSALQNRGVLDKKFVRRVADTRNYHTHYDPKLKSRAARDASMYWLSEELRVVLTACFLRDLGFDESRSWERLRATRLGASLMERH